MFTSKILNPRKFEENKRKSRNIGLEADMLIIFKFPCNFFFTASLSVHSERNTKSSLKLSPVGMGLVFGWVTSKVRTCREKQRIENSILTLKNAN